jgi:3-deoxy-D-manno-octulosonic-acid transferase
VASLVDFAYYGGLLLASPWLAYKLGHPRGRRHLSGIEERLGNCARRDGSRPCIWIHGVSVGEIRAAATLVEALERELPEFEIVLSTTTGTGQDVARRTYPDHRVFYFPLDFSWSVGRVFNAIRPDLVVLVELEIWPNFLQEAHRRRVPVALINGRITEKSYRGYRLVRGWLFDPIGKIGTFCVQTERYAQRFLNLGIPAKQIHVTGSVKYDQIQEQRVDPVAVRADLGVAPEAVILMGGSTHPSEEEALLQTYLELRSLRPELRLILVPRHTERTQEVVGQIRDAGLQPVRRTERRDGVGLGPLGGDQVLLVDTVGELGNLYAAADLVFVGGSLIPHGGQNMLEPIMYGKPTLFGSHCQNFREPVERLLAAEGARQVAGPRELLDVLRGWLSDPEAADATGARGREALTAAQGATQRTVEIIRAFLAERLPPRRRRGIKSLGFL